MVIGNTLFDLKKILACSAMLVGRLAYSDQRCRAAGPEPRLSLAGLPPSNTAW